MQPIQYAHPVDVRTDGVLDPTNAAGHRAETRRGLRPRHGAKLALAVIAVFGAGLWTGRSGSPAMRADLVDLAQHARPGGTFTWEVDRAGQVAVSGAEISLADLPARCREGAQAAAPGVEIEAVKRVFMRDAWLYEVDGRVAGRALELVMSPNGEVLGEEEELPPDQVPAAVIQTANAAVPEGRIVFLERVSGINAFGTPEYHVKKDVGGEIVRVRVTRGAVVEVLRIVPATIKVPRQG